jgi:hypothetical protein
MGIDLESKGYHVYWPGKRWISIEQNVSFVPSMVQVADDILDEGESEAPAEELRTSSHVQHAKLEAEAPKTPPQATQTLPTPSTPKLTRVRPAAGYYRALHHGEKASVAVETGESQELTNPIHWALAAAEPEPTLKEALSGPDAEEWQEAVDYEIGQLERLGAWEIVDAPPRVNVIPCHFVLATKRGPNGEKLKLRARLVANGQRQQEGLDYAETFAPTSHMVTIRMVLSMAAHQDWEIHQVDIKSAYLNATLRDDIYMQAPPGYLKLGDEGKVLKLLRSLYGLKQAGFEWSEELERFFLDIGFSRSQVDQAVYFKRTSDEHTVITVSVDDMAVTSKYLKHIKKFKYQLRERFEITDIGELTWLLGLKVKRDRPKRTISLSQGAYAETVLQRFHMEDAKPEYMPMKPSTILSTDQSPSTHAELKDMKDVPYQRAIGSLMYAAVSTRPNIAFPVAILSQFMRNPGQAHWL